MQIETVRTEGLGDSTYVLAHNGRGIIVDPQRDIDRFTSVVDNLRVEVRWVFETHLHNDYVSGAKDVARALGAELVLPAGAAPSYRHRPAFHREELTANELSIRPLHTPGHTPEHVSYVVIIEGQEVAVFSGGSLLVGSSGRSDLLGMERADSLARLQYRSIKRLADLPDHVGLYPTHGAGSFCTASQAATETSTIGNEKRTNPGLQHTDVDSFVADQLSGLVPYPSYYRFMGPTNLKGLDPVSLTPPPVIDREGFDEIDPEVTIVDARPTADFASGHIPGSLSMELRKDFGVWVGWVTPFNSRLLLVLNPDQSVEEAQRQLARIGYDRIVGVATDLDDWDIDLSSYPIHDVASFTTRMGGGVHVLDVRAPNEWESGTVDDSIRIYAPDLATAPPPDLDPSQPVLVACETGYRASLAASLLQRQGYHPEVLIGAGIPEVLTTS
ncbi:MAG: MBL fold metallo-hydrolase [Acidimicrobiia bacterium]